MGFLFSPFIVPVAGCAMILGIVVAGIWSGVRNREMQSQERLAAIAKGVPLPPTIEELAMRHDAAKPVTTRRRGNTRQGGIVLMGVAGGLIMFFIALGIILRERDVLAGAAVGLIPLGIGIGLLVDAKIQSRELAEGAGTGSDGANSTSLQRTDY